MSTFEQQVRRSAECAASVFATQGWTWRGVSEPAYTPTVDQIEETLWRLINNVRECEEGYSSSTGRLHAEKGSEGDVFLSMDLGDLEHFVADQVTA